MTNHNKRLLWQIPFLILLIVGTVLIIRQQHNTPYQKCAGAIFGTTYHITYQYDDDLQPELEAKMKEVDNALSMFNKESIISRVNNNQPVALNPMFVEVYSLMAIVGYQKIRCEKANGQWKIVKRDPRITLDCSAIAKGYGVDVVARLLEEKGITNYMVEIGGEVVTHGISEKRVPWKIGVTKPTDDPLQEGNELQTVLNLTDKAMATSGNYRNFYYKGKRKYAHTIDPKMGHPVQHNILSATVLTSHCMRADAYATAFMVMGFEGAKKVLERNPDLMAYIIYDDKGETKVWYSPSLKDKIAK